MADGNQPEFDPQAFVASMPPIPQWDAPTIHVGTDDTPWLEIAPGIEGKPLHFDLNQGLYTHLNRFTPGTKVPKHYHSGQVMGVTLQGEWWYEEAPDAINRPGSYLFEPAQCTHTLVIPEVADEPTVVWFALWGCNIQLKGDDSLDMVVDARGMLLYYRMLAQMKGESLDKVFVVGE